MESQNQPSYSGESDTELFSEINLTEWYPVEKELDETLTDIRKKVDTYRWFYLKNDKFDIIALRKKTVFTKYKNKKDFIGFKYQDMFKNEKNLIRLVCQLVNEMEKMKATGKVLFFRELYLATRKNSGVQKLFKTYIAEGNDDSFAIEQKENVDYYRWCFLVYRNRYNYIFHLIIQIFNYTQESLKSIKNYNDVFDFCLKNINDVC